MIRDLGSPPEKLFASFSPDPIASASLAQVRGQLFNNDHKVLVCVNEEQQDA
jgi:predicted unusual protein kinase regulating ubiquinone biosynthesis (AarF/ABC1/UbiB family)